MVDLWQGALKLRIKLCGEKHPEVAATLACLGQLYLSSGAGLIAFRFFTDALLMMEASLGVAHPWTMAVLRSLIRCTLSEGAHTYARSYVEGAVEPNPNPNPNTCARSIVERAVEGAERTLGDSHLGVSLCVNAMGEVYAAQGQPSQAMRIHQEALRSLKDNLGEAHLEVGATMAVIGQLLHRQQRHREALERLEEGTRIVEGALGSWHPRVRALQALILDVRREAILTLTLTLTAGIDTRCEERGSDTCLGSSTTGNLTLTLTTTLTLSLSPNPYPNWYILAKRGRSLRGT